MSCSRWHRLIALEVGGDLDLRRTRHLKGHLEGCAACRGFEEELRSQREVFIRLDREAADSVTLGSVRHAVMADLADRRRPFFPLSTGGRRLAFAGAAAIVVLVAAVILREGGAPSRPIVAERRAPTAVPGPETAPSSIPATDEMVEPPQEMAPPKPPEIVEREQLRIARADPSNPRQEPLPSRSVSTDPMTVKILTDDPDVVIYWVVEPKGAKENA